MIRRNRRRRYINRERAVTKVEEGRRREKRRY